MSSCGTQSKGLWTLFTQVFYIVHKVVHVTCTLYSEATCVRNWPNHSIQWFCYKPFIQWFYLILFYFYHSKVFCLFVFIMHITHSTCLELSSIYCEPRKDSQCCGHSRGASDYIFILLQCSQFNNHVNHCVFSVIVRINKTSQIFTHIWLCKC